MNDEQRAKRSYDSSLRLQQQEMTRDSIMAAVQELILTGRLHNFTIQEVADKSGVSYGTVYRHFPSREAILEGLIHWGLAHTLKLIPPYPARLSDLPGWAAQAVHILMPYLRTAAAIYAARAAVYNREVPASSKERDDLIGELIRQAAPTLPELHQRAAAATVRMWISMRTWAELHVRYGLEEEALALAVSEAITAQIEHLDQYGEGPPRS